MRRRQVWVSEEFGKQIKVEASKNGLTILEYTDMLAKGIKPNEGKRKTIEFRFF